MNIGANVRDRREREGLDQCELAERVHVTQVMISYIERGRKMPSVPLLKDIAKALHCTMDELAADRSA